jgi:hypothetical protein
MLNKIGQATKITRIEEAFVPEEYGMEVMGHKDPIFYGK